MSDRSIKNITLQPVQTLAKIFCVEVALMEEEYVHVSEGDVLGVILPSLNRIPIVGSSEEVDRYFLQYSSAEISASIKFSGITNESNLFAHLFATVGKYIYIHVLYCSIM